MKKALVLMLVALMLVACGPKPSEFWDSELHPLVIEFMNQDELAAQTPRGDLSPVISQMVSTSTRIEVLSESDAVPDCAVEGLALILRGTTGVIEGAEDFATIDFDLTDAQQGTHDSDASFVWQRAEGWVATGTATIIEDCHLTP